MLLLLSNGTYVKTLELSQSNPTTYWEMEETEVKQDDNGPQEKIGEKLAPFNPSDPKVVEIAVGLLELNDGDIVYDLGCGDGRFLIEVGGLLFDVHRRQINQ